MTKGPENINYKPANLQSQVNCQQKEGHLRTGEDICERHGQSGVSIQDTERTCTTQHQNQMTRFKWGEELNRHFSKEDIQTAKGKWKTLNVTDHQGNANQNHKERSLVRTAVTRKITNSKCWRGCGEGAPCTAGRNMNWAATTETSGDAL